MGFHGNVAEQGLYQAFAKAHREADVAKHFSRESGRFTLTGAGDVNTYALFAESFLQATATNGRAGFIVPTGIATDDSTKAYFGHIASGGRLASLYDFENSEAVFPSVHRSYKFSLMTLGTAPQAEFVCFATRVEHLGDARRRFTVSPEEFALINPNSLTCPIFRSRRDAELVKRLYGKLPVLIRDGTQSGNPWKVELGRMLHMSDDSGLFEEAPASPGAPPRLPLYEAKMVHQFDHRWATYSDAVVSEAGELETIDVGDAERADPTFTVRPRYWVDEREVLARIARVPARVARGWLALSTTRDAKSTDGHGAAMDAALSELLLALAQWVGGEMFHRAAGSAPTADGWTSAQAQPFMDATEEQFRARFPRLHQVLRGEGLTAKKALAEFPNWAFQNRSARLDEEELAVLSEALRENVLQQSIPALLDRWMDRRSPTWLFGFRNITNTTNERTFIGAVIPRVGVGHSMPLMFSGVGAVHFALLVGAFGCLCFDYVARQKVGGTNMTYGYLKQFPVLAPDCYTNADLAFIVPRVLELTYTAHDLQAWGQDLAAYDPRPAVDQGRPFGWNPERRAHLRAELDAYYARLYGLTRDELRYILDPKDVMGEDYPSETFRVLKEGEIRAHGEYRTRRLVLEAWDRQSR